MSRKTKMNSITTPELIIQINEDNKEIIDDFLDYLVSVQRSPKTIEQYKSDLLIFFVWNLQHNNNKFFVNLSKRDVVKYQNWLLNENKNSPARVRRLKAALSSLSGYIENVLDDEFPNFRNIINKVENPVNRPVREKTVWEDSELENLLDKLLDRKDYEKACYLALAMYSGRRKSELCRFKISDFSKDKLVCDGALYKSAPIKTKGRGNGKMIPCYTLAKKFQPYLDLWIQYRKEHDINSEWLFPNRHDQNKCLSISSVNSWSNTFSRLSGKSAYMHSLRHYFTTTLVRSGIPDSVITQIVGWESADMCKVYTDIEADEQIGMYFKNGDISVPQNKGLGDI